MDMMMHGYDKNFVISECTMYPIARRTVPAAVHTERTYLRDESSAYHGSADACTQLRDENIGRQYSGRRFRPHSTEETCTSGIELVVNS
jgi:hypothetical protein